MVERQLVFVDLSQRRKILSSELYANYGIVYQKYNIDTAQHYSTWQKQVTTAIHNCVCTYGTAQRQPDIHV